MECSLDSSSSPIIDTQWGTQSYQINTYFLLTEHESGNGRISPNVFARSVQERPRVIFF